MKYIRKQMVCDPKKSDEVELVKWINSKDHGFYSQESKKHMFELMRKEKEGEGK